MSLSTLLSELFTGSESESGTESPTAAPERGDSAQSITVVHECRDCGTNVSADTTQCPACESEDIVTHSID
ncbi:hypothetical protein [Natrinema sp. 1APR25-10V2]|uniref:hypothetical protein n=1 Tax=Natrinema sp. 1APR25-10V2 TaxID=2951081 RepID=UPI0028740B68|nr:hypothetical protein [Natrinema sp. 1APR25-10V2]MDS0475097.1 hypothetical protein [Natrinema sp. 1APR25-10V2]